MRKFHDWPWPADPNIGLVVGIDTAAMPDKPLFVVGMSQASREERRIRELEMDVRRLKDYWLCLEGLTFGQFLDGQSCVTCGMGIEHADGMDADRQEGIAMMYEEARANR